jgi:hypothetical protein
MSPAAPTFVILNARLIKAHHRIRELEARESELVARNRTLCAVNEQLTSQCISKPSPSIGRAKQ